MDSQDDKTIRELTAMARVYTNRGNFEMAEKLYHLAAEIQERVNRTAGANNVISLDVWAQEHKEQAEQGEA